MSSRLISTIFWASLTLLFFKALLLPHGPPSIRDLNPLSQRCHEGLENMRSDGGASIRSSAHGLKYQVFSPGNVEEGTRITPRVPQLAHDISACMAACDTIAGCFFTQLYPADKQSGEEEECMFFGTAKAQLDPGFNYTYSQHPKPVFPDMAIFCHKFPLTQDGKGGHVTHVPFEASASTYYSSWGSHLVEGEEMTDAIRASRRQGLLQGQSVLRRSLQALHNVFESIPTSTAVLGRHTVSVFPEALSSYWDE